MKKGISKNVVYKRVLVFATLLLFVAGALTPVIKKADATDDFDWAWSSGSGTTGDLYRTGNVSIGTSSIQTYFKTLIQGDPKGLYVKTSDNTYEAIVGQCHHQYRPAGFVLENRYPASASFPKGVMMRFKGMDTNGVMQEYLAFVAEYVTRTAGAIDGDCWIRPVKNGGANWAFRFTHDGKLLIKDGGAATDLPTATLDVRGSATFNADGGDYDFRVGGRLEGNLLYIDAFNDEIGIGTNDPDSRLHIGHGGFLITGSTGTTPPGLVGQVLTWIPAKAAFRAGYFSGSQLDDANIGVNSTALGCDTIASGDYATAVGWDNNATGSASIAMGGNTRATGDRSIAMGSWTLASGEASTAMGYNTGAEADYATAMGYHTVAFGANSTVMGREVEVHGDGSVGIGLDGTPYSITDHNVMCILGGNVGIGALSPDAKLHVKDGAVLFNGSTGSTPASGVGTRFMWIPSKAAFRAGFVEGSQWDDGNIGDYSVAMGYNTTASNSYSTAMGISSTASGGTSTAMGYGTTASGDFSTAMGYGTTASGNQATAMGYNTRAIGSETIAMGANTDARGTQAVSMGAYTDADGNYATAMGYYTNASGLASVAMGYQTVARGSQAVAMGSGTNASGDWSTAMGFGTKASGHYSTAIGEEIEASGSHSIAIALNDQNGNVVSQPNTMAIMGGKVGIGVTSPGAELDVNGTTMTNILILDKLTSAPGSPTDGMVVYADGSTWNPGSGEGIYAYYNSGWQYLG